MVGKKLFSTRNRPVECGPFPLERLRRTDRRPPLTRTFTEPLAPPASRPKRSLARAIARYQAMLDIVRDGTVRHRPAEIPEDPAERARHLKAAAYYFDASMVGVCALEPEHFLNRPIANSGADAIRDELARGQPKIFAGGIDLIYADIAAAAHQELGPARHHTHAIALLIEHTREPTPAEPGFDWIAGAQRDRAALLTANAAVLLANYLRLLGYEARAHSLTARDVDLERVALSAGLTQNAEGGPRNPFVGAAYGLAVVTTQLEIAPDRPLADGPQEAATALRWRLGYGTARSRKTALPYADRAFHLGPHPFETLKRTDRPTTMIDEDAIPRVAKRSDFFARAIYGDLGKSAQDAAKGGMYVSKSPIGACARRALGALLLLQYGEARDDIDPSTSDPEANALNIKAASYYLACDAVGLSRCPDWTYYSHNAGGEPIEPYHSNAISLLLDQGHETMEGASGDDWISAAQSMRAYLRFSLIGGVIAEHIRLLGYSARVHSVLDGEVLQPPLLLLAGLGEVSRIGDVIVNPFLGPRLKSGAVTTSMPMSHDRPIDFGMQSFCGACRKCARECPSGAITAGPKVVYNGYELWRSDPEKCSRYRVTNKAGAMCGRCMKTCPWNFEGLFQDAAFRWLAQNAPGSAKALAELDDRMGRGRINPVKKWWWDIEIDDAQTRFVAASQVNRRELQRELELRYEDQTLAAYPAALTPQPWPVPQPIDREAGVAAYRSLPSVASYLARKKAEDPSAQPARPRPAGPPPVFPVRLSRRRDLSDDVMLLEFQRENGEPMPAWEAGAHIDVVVAPEYQRQYSLTGDPAERSRYTLGIQREAQGRGGSLFVHQVFKEGRTVFISEPRNHFPLDETAALSILMAGGVGVTPMIAMAHRLHAIGKEFVLHFSARDRARSGFAEYLQTTPWADNVFLHFSAESGRADLDALVPSYRRGLRLYTCGGVGYMDAVFAMAANKGWPEDAYQREFFAAPDAADYENHAFQVRLRRSGRTLTIPEDRSVAEVLQESGVSISLKCSDGICGVCATVYTAGEVEHRDVVLSAEERARKMIVCCSRAKSPGGVIELDL